MKLQIGLGKGALEGVCKLLGDVLADEMVLATKLRRAHWNVTGLHFHSLHELFGQQYEAVDETVDEVAERIRQLGGFPEVGLAAFARRSRLQESPAPVSGPSELLAGLLSDQEAVIRQLRQDVETCESSHGDVGTADYLTGLLQKHEKMAWMLRASLQEAAS